MRVANFVNPTRHRAGSISISDVDQNQASLQTTVTGAAGNLGSLSLAANGSYTYTVSNAAVQYLGGNDSKIETFTVTALDGTSKAVSFTIHGSNDAAVIGTPTVADVTEDTAVNGAGNLVAALEMLVHLQAQHILEDYLLARVSFDEALLEVLAPAQLPG